MLYLKAEFVILLLAFVLWVVPPVVGEDEGEIIIGNPEIRELFAAQCSCYQSRSAGSISIRNNTDKDLCAEVSVTVPGYTLNRHIVAASLEAGKETQIPMKMDFCMDKLPKEGESFLVDAEIEVCVYGGEEQLCRKKLRDKFRLHSLHRLPSGPPETIAVFVDPNDQLVTEVARKIKGEPLNSNSEKARRLFGLMQQAGILYSMEQAAETICYPRELLRIGVGSTHDWVLLYAALLENCNVPVALTMCDEYILVLIQQEKQVAGHGQKELVSWNGKLWLPIDIRALKATFSEAKAAGMKLCEDFRREAKMKPFILREAWDQYPPVRFVLPRSVEKIDLGIRYAHRGYIQEAEDIFSECVDDDIAAAALNNLGNLCLRCGNLERAVEYYQKAISKDPSDGAIYLNLGIAYAIKDKKEEAAAMFDNAFREMGSYAQMCYALALDLDEQEFMPLRLLLDDAEKRAGIYRTRPLGGRGSLDNKQSPLYWKRS